MDQHDLAHLIANPPAWMRATVAAAPRLVPEQVDELRAAFSAGHVHELHPVDVRQPRHRPEAA